MCSQGMLNSFLVFFFFFSLFWFKLLKPKLRGKFLQGKVPFISEDGIHQLHIFIFVLAISHVLYCITTLALGRAKVLFSLVFVSLVFSLPWLLPLCLIQMMVGLQMRKWKAWEMETRTANYQFSHGNFIIAKDNPTENIWPSK